MRRAALGIIALILENKLRLPLRSFFEMAIAQADFRGKEDLSHPEELFDQLISFFSERLKVYLRERGTRYDLIDAVFALPDQDDLLLIVSRVAALQRFLETEDGKNLAGGLSPRRKYFARRRKKRWGWSIRWPQRSEASSGPGGKASV